MTRAGMTAADVDRFVLEVARLHRWLAVHYRTMRTADGRHLTGVQGDSGAPDWLLVKPPRLILAETKSARDVLRPMQRQWRAAIEGCPGVEYYLWRPADLDSIIEVLGR